MHKIIKAKYPSNIALVKYWGKYGNQLPCNASISMTLQKAVTTVELHLADKKTKGVEFEYYFEGKIEEKFKERVLKYLQSQKEFKEVIDNFSIRVNSTNSFPHSTGIASSASAFASLAAVFLKATKKWDSTNFNRKASSLARLGSGSASRSFEGPYTLWGDLKEIKDSSEKYAIPVLDIHDDFRSMRDTILIVEDTPKEVSSTVGHSLMKNHPFAKAKFQQADYNCLQLISILKTGDFDAFISIVEREALTLHAMMMSSKDYYLLLKPQTVRVIEKIFEWRKATGYPICFTLDAGPNIHLLYPKNVEKLVHSFIEKELKEETKNIIFDEAGDGGEIF